MTFKLVDLYNTKFFYITYVGDLLYLRKTILALQKDKDAPYHAGSPLHAELYEAVKRGEEIVIDVADARFTTDTKFQLVDYQRNGIKLIDSKNATRNKIFEENRERLNVDKTSFVQLPTYTNRMRLQDYMKELSRDVTYIVPNDKEELYVPLVILIVLTRPTINICFDSKDKTILRHVSSFFTAYELSQYENFYFISDYGVMTLEKNSKGLYDLQHVKDLKLEEVLSYGRLVPDVFGKKRLLTEEPWASLAQKCFSLVDAYKQTYQPTIAETLNISC